ncbi:hypothetical protein Tco_0801816 [Tanacetum coccineum]|uniref:Uncharacterized protein n=1 Tax=Tanacetum coccineum TaxID=301880 RepID=A0ABQ5A1B3_9ASTR
MIGALDLTVLDFSIFSLLVLDALVSDSCTLVMDIQQKDKNKARRTKPSTGIKRVQEIEVEGVYILNGPTRSHFIGPVIPQTTAISNIKLPILKKEEYDIWAMEMEHYLEYIDNEVWKVIQNGNSKKRISTGKDGIVRVLSPVTAAEIQAVEKERKAKNILLMAIPKEHMRRFHGMDDAKEIWEAIRTRFGGNANSKKMQKAVFKQQFEAFRISNSEGLEKGYDRFQQLLSQLEAHGAEVSTEDANHKFLRSLPSAWSNLAMTMRTNPEIDNLSIDDFKSSNNKVKSGFSGAYSSCTPSTSSRDGHQLANSNDCYSNEEVL